jgi:hypothetical protein
MSEPVARASVLPCMVIAALTAVFQGASTGLRSLDAAKRGLLPRLVHGPLVVVGGLLGTVRNGAQDARWGMGDRQFAWGRCVVVAVPGSCVGVPLLSG